MSSFNADKKREHEALAEKALQSNDFDSAFSHICQAAEYTFNLAEQSEGQVARAYLNDANNLVQAASKLKEKCSGGQKKNSSGASGTNSAGSDNKDSDMRLGFRPKERLSDVSGMEAAKEEVQVKVIAPVKDPDAKKYGLKAGGAILLYGLPGTGKTFFAQAVAGELDLPFYVLDVSQIMNKYVGESQKAIKELFDTARSNPMSVIFIDEVDAVLASRGGESHETSKQVLNIILQEMNGIDSDDKNPFLLIGATNYPNRLDDAALSRFTACLEVELPDNNTRRAILKRDFFNGLSNEITVDDAVMEFLVGSTDGFSCRDMVKLASHMRSKAYLSKVQHVSLEFCKENFVDSHIVNADVARDVAEFKKRIGTK